MKGYDMKQENEEKETGKVSGRRLRLRRRKVRKRKGPREQDAKKGCKGSTRKEGAQSERIKRKTVWRGEGIGK